MLAYFYDTNATLTASGEGKKIVGYVLPLSKDDHK